jgi:ketosteroid isomerase-like protein
MSKSSMAVTGRSIHQVFDHHLQAFAEGLDAIVSDYAESSVIVLPEATYRGLAEIRAFFGGFLDSIQPGFWDAFRVRRQWVEGDVAYLVWEAKPFVALATDTLLIRDGVISIQTFTSFAGTND